MLKKTHPLFACCSMLLLIILSACHNQSARQEPVALKTDTLPKPDRSVEGSFSDQHALHLDSTNISSLMTLFPLFGKYTSDVKQFYRYRNFSYAWYETSGMIEQANHLYTRLNNLEDEVILVKPPYINILDSLINDPSVTGKADSVLEILLTAEYLFSMEWNTRKPKFQTPVVYSPEKT
jgi:hypothetical protein